MKGLFRRQVLVLISIINLEKIMKLSNKYMANINKALKDIKLNIIANFINTDNRDLTIITNKVAFTLDLNTIEKYIKNIDVINLDNIRTLKLSQLKLYLKIYISLRI